MQRDRLWSPVYRCLRLALVPADPAGARSSRSREPSPLAASAARGFFFVRTPVGVHFRSFVLDQPVFQGGCS